MWINQLTVCKAYHLPSSVALVPVACPQSGVCVTSARMRGWKKQLSDCNLDRIAHQYCTFNCFRFCFLTQLNKNSKVYQ